jgi:hypothetical membrane protein
MATSSSGQHDPLHQTSIHLESRAVQIAALAGIATALIGFAVFWNGNVQLFAPRSVGTVAAVSGSVLGAAAFCSAYLRSLGTIPPRADDRLGIGRRILDTSALAINHVAIWLVLSLGTFNLLQSAFRGLELDTLTATLIVAVTVAVATYFMQASGGSITSYRVSSLLSVFIVSGMLASMITAPDPDWWKANFSNLGTMGGFSGFAFNFTLIATGGLIATLADYMTADVRRWARTRPDVGARAVFLVGWGIFGEGASLAAVGLFPVNRFLVLHNTVACSLVIIFLALVFSIPRLLPDFSRTFFLLGYAFVASVVVVTLLYFPVGYYNLTALELVAAAVILGWIVIFIRTAAARGNDLARHDAPVRSEFAVPGDESA